MLEVLNSWDSLPVCSLIRGFPGVSRHIGTGGNDLRGSTAYPPSMLLKVVLFAYSQGIVSSRIIERACRDHVTFMALSGDSAPHFTTIADFVSGRGSALLRSLPPSWPSA
jgi:transposase